MLALSWLLLADVAPEPKRTTWDPRIFWTTLILVGVLLVGALIIAIVERWRKKPAQDRLSAGDQLSHFRSLYERGELSREEFERIKATLTGRMRKELQLPSAGQEPVEKPHQPPPGGLPRNGPPTG